MKIMKAKVEYNQVRHLSPTISLDRPVHKLVLLLPSEEPVNFNKRETREFPNEEPNSQ